MRKVFRHTSPKGIANNFPKTVKNQKGIRKRTSSGFTLSEVLTTVSIIGVLSSIAAPTFQAQYSSSCQSQPENIINALMATTQAYNDEFGTPATSWSDLDQIGTIMTKNGPAVSSSFGPIPMTACEYWLEAEQTGHHYIFSATRSKAKPTKPYPVDNFNVHGCLNTATGTSQIILGDGNQPASIGELNCD